MSIVLDDAILLYFMKQFNIKMLKKKENTTYWKYVPTQESILVLWFRSQTR